MENKKFDEIMQKYVVSTAKGSEVDFSKLERGAAVRKNLPIRKLLFSSFIVMLVLAVSLSVAIPLAISSRNGFDKFDGQKGGINFCSDISEINLEEIGGLSELSTKYGFNTLCPTIKCNISSASILTAKNNPQMLFGAFVSLYAAGSDYESIEIYMLPENSVINSLLYYENYSNLISWNGFTVNYNREYDYLKKSYNLECFFNDGNYKYYMEIRFPKNIATTDVLNMVYFAEVEK
ncbi:MAG: hypothetical protein RRY78_00625 [Clostridia bacterium]